MNNGHHIKGKAKNKKGLVILSFFAVLIIFTSFLPLLGNSTQLTPAVKMIQLLMFLIEGMLFSVAMTLSHYLLPDRGRSVYWRYAAGFTLLILISFILFYSANTSFPFMLLLGGCSAFLLPSVIGEVWHYFRNFSVEAGEETENNPDLYLSKEKEPGKIRILITNPQAKKEATKSMSGQSFAAFQREERENIKKTEKERLEKIFRRELEEALEKQKRTLENLVEIEAENISKKKDDEWQQKLEKSIRIAVEELKKLHKTELTKSLESFSKTEKEKYEIQLENEQKKVKEEERSAYELMLKQEIENILKQNHEQQSDRTKHDENQFEIILLQQATEIAENERATYEIKIKQFREELQQSEKQRYQDLLNLEIEKINRTTKENYELQIAKELEQILEQEKQQYKADLLRETEKLRGKYLLDHENFLSEQNDTYKREIKTIEQKMSQELEKINKEKKEGYEIELRNQKSEWELQQKQNYEILLDVELLKISNELEKKHEQEFASAIQNLKTEEKALYEVLLAEKIRELNTENEIFYKSELLRVKNEIISEDKSVSERTIQQLESTLRTKTQQLENEFQGILEKERTLLTLQLENELTRIKMEEKEYYEQKLAFELKNMRQTIPEKAVNGIDKPHLILNDHEKQNESVSLSDFVANSTNQQPNYTVLDKPNKELAAIAFTDTRIWQYKPTVGTRSPMILLDSVTIYLQFSTENTADSPDMLFTILTSLDMKLGDLFDHFINTKARARKLKIDFSSDVENSVGWKFYTRGMMGLKKRELDPQISLRKNKIRESGLIFIMRYNG